MSEKVEIIPELKDLISGKFADINKQIDAMDSKLGAVGQKGSGSIMGQVLGANLLTGAIQKAGSAVYQFGKDSFDAYGRAEQFQTSLNTLLYGNKQQAEALNNQLKQFALETPFELTEIQQGTKMMIAYGSSAGGVVEEMRMLGDIGAGVGSSLSEMAYLYGTLRTQGIAYTKDLNQFTGRGIPIVKELAKQFGVADSEIRKMVEDGKIGFKEIERAFQSMTAEGGQFNNMMAAQSKTLLGQTSNLADAWDQLKAGIGQSQSGILKGTISWATEMVNAIKTIVDKDNYRESARKGLSDDMDLNKTFGSYQSEKDEKWRVRAPGMADVLFKSAKDAMDFQQKTDGYRQFGDVNQYRTTDAYKDFADRIFNIKKDATGVNAQEKLNELIVAKRDIESASWQGEMSKVLAANELAVISEAIKSIASIKSLYDEDKKKKKEDASAATPKKLEEAAKANKAVQVNVNIENLVRELTNVNENASTLNQLTTDGTLKALTVAVNNIYAVGQ